MSGGKHKLDGEITTILPGVAIYKTHASPYYQARIRLKGKYAVRSTKETSKISARQAALELAKSLHELQPQVPKEYTFKSYALRWLATARQLAENGERNVNYYRTERTTLERDTWGLLTYFGEMDVRNIRTKNFNEFRDRLKIRKPDLSASTHNTIQACFRNVMKVARDDGVIDNVPDTPKLKQKDNPRTFFRFKPLVDRAHDEYALLRKTVLDMVQEGVTVRGTPVTEELYDLILFTVHSFVRPTTTELYAIRHRDISVADNPKRLLVTIRRGKTGHRIANTMPGAVSAYHRIRKRYPDAKPEDYIFLPDYENRSTAARVIQRQFNAALERADLKFDQVTGTERTVYSLRHTAICLRIVKSEGQVNIYNLAKNAGTSVQQIERFYARNMPLSPELARNLQAMPIQR